MPRIDLYRKPQFISDSVVRVITASLREAVARLLSDGTLENQLTPEQVEVRVSDGHLLDDNTCDVAIDISAKTSDGRKGTCRRIVIELAELMRKIVPPMVGDPPRVIDTWIELDLGDKTGRKIWSKEDLPAS
ncbi:MAG: hypothetical protein HYY50_05765 [Candidatus Kerfeldbacteria bacterium]|nr:hypothetical protein [Candidatus Kerfeldbacteria bacterium]